ncbi:MAG TPA: FAD-dependent oxidoreductase [Vicinamibacteria bacterium]|nr:FAD-dependent oxidoreductase [Vicinamibacteria bacterium]
MKRDLAALAAREWDVAVVGGGIYGAAVAWDAAQRGLAVALVEREDFGAGASWSSLKTIHGGMRYLQKLDLVRLRQSARERSTLLAIAPGIVRPLPFVVPTYGHGPTGREALALGLLLNDGLTRDRNRGLPPDHQIPAARTVSRAEALRLVPGIESRGLTGAALWHDAQASSTERLTLAFLHAAVGAGALVANHAEAVSLPRASGRVAGVAVRDTLDGRTIEVRARLVVNAAGPWADEVLARGGLRRAKAPLLRARNVVLRKPPAVPFAVAAKSEGRFLFLVPWEGHTIVGTSYEPADGPPSDPMAFLDEATRAFPWAGIERADAALVHEGLVPGRGGASGLSTRARLHDHEAEDGVPGLVSLQGVKYTTARLVAEQAVDLAVRRLGRHVPACRTAVTPLPAARPLAGPLEERARTAVRDEMALTLADAVLRRLDLGTAGPPSPAEADAVARVMTAELGWDAGRERAEKDALARFYRS